MAALPPMSLSNLPISVQLTFQLPLSVFWTQMGTSSPLVLHPVVYILGVFTSPTCRSPSSLLASFSGILAACSQSTINQKYQAQNSRKKQDLSFELWTILNNIRNRKAYYSVSPELWTILSARRSSLYTSPTQKSLSCHVCYQSICHDIAVLVLWVTLNLLHNSLIFQENNISNFITLYCYSCSLLLLVAIVNLFLT